MCAGCGNRFYKDCKERKDVDKNNNPLCRWCDVPEYMFGQDDRSQDYDGIIEQGVTLDTTPCKLYCVKCGSSVGSLPQ